MYATHYGYVKCTVLAIEWVVDGYLVEVENEGGHKFRQTPDEFIHQRPVLDAGGVPIKTCQKMWRVRNGEEVRVSQIDRGEHPLVTYIGEDGLTHEITPDGLTHTKPEPPDSRRAIINEIGDEMAARIDLLVSSGRWSDAD